MSQLSIVIVNFRTPELVISCLSSLALEANFSNFIKVQVVDNKSNDNSIELISNAIQSRKWSNWARIIESPFNSGFSGGNNTGILSEKSDYYLLLNSDTIVRQGAISILMETASRFKNAGLYSPRLEWPDGSPQESCFRFHSPIREFVSASQTRVIETLFKRFTVAMPVQTTIAYPEWTSFACVLIKREVFEDIGLLDDGYFMYFEDVEFCHRARKAGWSIVHNPDSRVIHLRGGSSPVKEKTKQKKRLPRYFYESRARFYYQLYGWSGLTAANILWCLGRCISLARQLLGRKDKSAVEKQWLDIWINWLSPLHAYTHPENSQRISSNDLNQT